MYPQLMTNYRDDGENNICEADDREQCIDSLINQLRSQNGLIETMSHENQQLAVRVTELNERTPMFRELQHIERFRMLRENLESIDFDIETVSGSIALIEERILNVELMLERTELSLRK